MLLPEFMPIDLLCCAIAVFIGQQFGAIGSYRVARNFSPEQRSRITATQ